MTSIAVKIHQALAKDEGHTPDSIARLIEQTGIEADRLSVAVQDDERALSDIRTPEDQLAAVEQRMTANKRERDRLAGAVPLLDALREKIVLRERDAQQKARYAHLVKRREIVARQIAQFLETLPAVATALHEAVQLNDAAKVFNNRPTPGTPLNPADNLVSSYKYLPPIVPEVVLGNSRLVDGDGTILFGPADAPRRTHVSAARPDPVGSSQVPPTDDEKRVAEEKRAWAAQWLTHLAARAATIKVNLVHAASLEGMTHDDLRRLQDVAAGKDVNVDRVREKLDETGENPTS